MHLSPRQFIFATWGLLTAGFSLSAEDEQLVKTQLLQDLQMEAGDLVQINLNDFFQVYPSPGPVATFQITIPVVDGVRPMYTQTITSGDGKLDVNREVNAQQHNVLAYEVSADSPDLENYDSPYAIYPGDLLWETVELPFQLLPEAAPMTVANFMTYASLGWYENTHIHRKESAWTAGFSILQSGGFTVDKTAAPHWLDVIDTFSPVPLEASLPHEAGTLGLARTNDPNSGTSQFFINLGDNTSVGGAGEYNWSRQYAVFGRFAGEDLASLEGILNAITFNFTLNESLRDIPPEGYAGAFQKTPVVTVYLDVSPDNWFYFDDITVEPGSTDGITHTVVLAPEGNPTSFELNQSGSILSIKALTTGTAQLTVTAEKDGLASQSFSTQMVAADPAVMAVFSSATIAPDNWLSAGDFGWFNTTHFPYILHINHGYQSVAPGSTANKLFLYDLEDYRTPEKESIGWIYTSTQLYPWLYIYEANDWYYFFGGEKGKGARWFQHHSGTWITDIDLP